MTTKYEAQKARRRANIAAGLRYNGTPRKERVATQRRDHVAEVEAGLALGFNLDQVAADMGLRPQSVVIALTRKGRMDLVRRLGIRPANNSRARG